MIEMMPVGISKHTARVLWLDCSQIFLERYCVVPRTFPVGDLLFLLLLFRSSIEVQIVERRQLVRRLFGLKAGYCFLVRVLLCLRLIFDLVALPVSWESKYRLNR